jgi:plasmid stability protein
VNITVKNIPDSIYRVMKREAKRKRRSLNAEIIQALETEAAEAERRRQLSKLRKELDRFAASLPPLDDSVPLIRGDRGR